MRYSVFSLIIVVSGIFSQAEANDQVYQGKLKNKVTVRVSESPTGGRLTAQYAVNAICEAAGVPYQWQKSQELTGGRCANYIKTVNVKDVPAEKAIQAVLTPLGLTFSIDESGLYLTTAFAQPNPGVNRDKQLLQQAREMLTGQDKNLPDARRLLVRFLKSSGENISPSDRCYALVYLGYIEDLKGNREKALTWFKKASKIKDPGTDGIRAVAKEGLNQAITWIKHLDKDIQPPPKKTAIQPRFLERIGEGYISKDMPSGLVPDNNLSNKQMLENFDILAEAIDRSYSFFEHKQIDFNEITVRYKSKVRRVRKSEQFYYLLYEFVRELKDTHSWLCNYKDVPSLGWFRPEVSLHLVEDNIVVVDAVKDSPAYREGLQIGTIITKVDGLTVEEKFESLKPLLKVSSSERNFREKTARRLLDGDEGTMVLVEFKPPDTQQMQHIRLKRVRYRDQYDIKPGFDVMKGKFIWYGVHPSGFGYIRILSFNGRQEIADEFDKALEHLKDTSGLIIDVRENTGGFGTAQPRMVGRFIKKSANAAVSYIKSGPEHRDFRSNQTRFEPAGDWQYTKPLALLTNAMTGSATDLFIAYMVSATNVITVGETTHGNLTGTCVYLVLPCNLVVRVSSGYVCDASGRIIERDGNVPDIHVKPTIEDIINGRDTVLERAIEVLRGNVSLAGGEQN